ncbi:hypothetical protein EF294_01165 [Gordonia oryzae]|uniref:Uncharacterized protein n=1 Tax=Gordonia oryzae TaxID=2487349 RepID=A0A3N4H4A5_9ACTN|nr:hypothetical protein EF294_01165 [Gordonia oryzae]
MEHVDGVEVPLLPRAPLMRLCCSPMAEVVPTIIDDLWHQSPPRKIAGTPQSHVSTRRGVLESADAQKSPEAFPTGSGHRFVHPWRCGGCQYLCRTSAA